MPCLLPHRIYYSPIVGKNKHGGGLAKQESGVSPVEYLSNER